MRPVWRDALAATERWHRLAVSLAISIAAHCLFLSFTGLTAFRLLSQQGGARSARLTVGLPNQPQPPPAENTPQVAAASAAPSVATRHFEPPQPSNLPNTESRQPAATATVDARPSGLFRGPWYYAARYLHRRPTPLKPIRPVYPVEAENIPGQVILLLLLNEKGTVDSYQVIDSKPPGRFDNTVVEAFNHEAYAPGLITGYAVKSQLLVEVVFEPGTRPEASILQHLPQVKIRAEPVPSATGN